MDEKGIKALARGISKAPLRKRIKLIETLLKDLNKFYGKNDFKQYII